MEVYSHTVDERPFSKATPHWSRDKNVSNLMPKVAPAMGRSMRLLKTRRYSHIGDARGTDY